MVDLTVSHYSTGTATVAANGTVVTGQGTAWAGAIRPGDLFGTHRGLSIRIASVNSNTSITLARAWPGPAQTAAAYEIQLTPYDVGYRKAIEDLVTGISDGNLPLLAALVGAANKLPYFDSANSMATADFPAWARSMLSQPGSADKIPYLTGANGAALTTLTGAARSILAAATVLEMRNALGLGEGQGPRFGGLTAAGGNITSQQAAAGGNAHYWLRRNDGSNAALIYWNASDGGLRIQTYNQDGTGAVTNLHMSGGTSAPQATLNGIDILGSKGSGWLRWGNGGLVQAGSTVITLNSNGDGTIFFPTAFASQPSTVVVSNGSQSALLSSVFSANATGATAFNVRVRPSPGAVLAQINYIAMGDAP